MLNTNIHVFKNAAEVPFYFSMHTYSLPSINVNPREWIKLKLTFIEVLTVNNYKIIFLSNIQILTFINISNCEESLWRNTIHKIANPIKSLFNIKFANHGWSMGFYHPYYGWISSVNIYRVKFTKKGVPFCDHLTRLTFILINMWGVEES